MQDGLATRCLKLGYVPRGVVGFQCLDGGGEILKRDEVHHQPAVRLQVSQAQCNQIRQFAAGTADEHRIRIGPGLQPFRRLALKQCVVVRVQPAAVIEGDGGVLGVLLDGVYMTIRTKTRRLEADRARACADVPDDAVRAQLHARERASAHLALGDKTLVGLALPVAFIGETELHVGSARRRAPQQHDVGVGEAPLCGIGDSDIHDDIFVRLQQAFGHRHAELIVQPLAD